MDIERLGTTRRYSDIVIHGDTLYLVEVPLTADADITTQTREVLASLDASLAKAGSDKTRLLHVTLYLPSMADYDAMNAVWDAWVPQGHTPARATGESALATPDYKVEIIVVAAQN